MEIEKTAKQVNLVSEPIKIDSNEEAVLFDDGATTEEIVFTEEISEEEDAPIAVESISQIEETTVLNRITMPSRKLKLKISNGLLNELEKMQINFKLN